jgi:GT2 family glycosyltransferase
MTGRGISVVVPTRGRERLVELLLDSLGHCDRDGALDVEILVVDDSDEPAATAIRRACHRHRADYLRGEREVGRKRNLGARRARHPIVLFIDSDCVATRGLLLGHERAHRGQDAQRAGVAGPTYFYGSQSLTARLTERSMVYEAFRIPESVPEVLWATTSNLSVNREAFLSAGGFAENPVTVVGGEDVDLGIRLHHLGFTIGTAPDAAVLHARSQGLGLLESVRKLFTYGRADNWLCGRHPEYAAFHPNPATLTLLGLAAGVGPLRSAPGLVRAAIATGPVVLTALAEWSRRRRSDRPVHALDLLAIPLDWAFDLGVLMGALGDTHIADALTRFDCSPARTYRPR